MAFDNAQDLRPSVGHMAEAITGKTWEAFMERVRLT